MISRKFIQLIGIVFLITTFGTFGFMIVEGWGLIDAFYMTVITVTTTGYEEVNKLSTEGRVFTVVLLGFGFTGIAYVSSQVITELVVTVDIRRRRKMEARIRKLSGHTIVLGYGRMGSAICEQLANEGHDFVVIEKAENAELLRSNPQLLWIEGDAAHDERLRAAGVEYASTMVSAIDSDSDSLFAAIAAKSLNPKIRVIVRADSEEASRKMLIAGVDQVILPYVMSGKKIASSILHPEIDDFFEIAGAGGNSLIQLSDIKIDSDSPLHGCALRDCGLTRETLTVVGVKSGDEFKFGPSADYVFQNGDTVFVIGTPESYSKAARMLGV